MNKQHILGFFDALVRTPVFLFLCAVFLCGAVAGGLTGLYAGAGDGTVDLVDMLTALPEQTVKSVFCAVLWILLPLGCGLLRPQPLLLSAVAAARGYVLALTVAVSLGQGGSIAAACAAGLPAVLSVSALLAACTMVWQAGERGGPRLLRACRAPYALCVLLAAAGALLRAGIAVLFRG